MKQSTKEGLHKKGAHKIQGQNQEQISMNEGGLGYKKGPKLTTMEDINQQ